MLKRLQVNGKSGAVLGASGKVRIGNNVFIGMNSIILRNVTIGDNVIIGAGSVVTKNCESGGVYAGNPAKRIVSIEDFYRKREECQIEEAKELAIAYMERYGHKPPVEIFHEYFMLFSNTDNLCAEFQKKLDLCQNYDDSVAYYKEKAAPFRTYEEFLEYCFEIKM